MLGAAPFNRFLRFITFSPFLRVKTTQSPVPCPDYCQGCPPQESCPILSAAKADPNLIQLSKFYEVVNIKTINIYLSFIFNVFDVLELVYL